MKKDNFGVWNHSGSHDKKFECRFGPEIGKSMLSTGNGWETFFLRRLHSYHPTNANFRRMIAFITGEHCVLVGKFCCLL